MGNLYPTMTVASDSLSEPFTISEITHALFSMDVHASPGPDGFGPSFYRQFWPSLKNDVLDSSWTFTWDAWCWMD